MGKIIDNDEDDTNLNKKQSIDIYIYRYNNKLYYPVNTRSTRLYII